MDEDIKKVAAVDSSEAALIKACQAGNKDAFDVLMGRNQHKIYNICYVLLGDHHEAEDAAQDTFIKAYRAIHQFRLESAFSTYLYRIAVNTCTNRIKSMEYKFKKFLVRFDRSDSSNDCDPVVDIKDDAPLPVAQLMAEEKTRAIRKAINSLPDDWKTVVVLRDVEGLAYEEIEEITGFNLGTVKSRLARARTQLKKKLAGVF
ncbi:MAG: sigma-70 family RNA polymerase sigma factor [Deltaproteobacteria bacterium]|nr:sigma-70 family RNA polymerase sigma factor [Deltaproteobacteria bacterium]